MKKMTTKQTASSNFIKAARSILNMRAEDFGEACGLTGKHRGRTVYRWEHGELIPSGPVRKVIDNLLRRHSRMLSENRQPSNPNPQEGQV